MKICSTQWSSVKRCLPGALLDRVRAWRTLHTCGQLRSHRGRCRCACGAKTRTKASVAA